LPKISASPAISSIGGDGRCHHLGEGAKAVGEEVEVSELRELRREVANLRVENDI